MSSSASLQTTLAAEHAAIFVYGDAGAHTSQSGDPELFATITALYRVHRARRDRLQLILTDRGEAPVPAAATYDVPGSFNTPAAVRARLLRLEGRFTEIYAAMVAGTVGTDRGWAITALSEAAQSRIALGGEPETFPGAPELG